METFNVASVQMNALADDLEHNLEVHRRFAKEAAEQDCKLVLFPETSATAHYGDPKATQFAEEAGEGPIFKFVCDQARENNINIAYGFCEKADGTFYNSHAIVGPDGLLSLQRKTHASHDEYFYFRMGREYTVCDLGFAKVATLICFDARFFEAWRLLAIRGAEVFLLPHAARSSMGKELSERKQQQVLKKLLKKLPGEFGAFAGNNLSYAVYCNQFGFNGHCTHGGGAYVLDTRGEVENQAGPKLEDLMLVTTLEAEKFGSARRCLSSTLRVRRPELYSGILD